MLSPNINILSILSIFNNFNAPITLTGSVAEISDPYANANSNESAFLMRYYKYFCYPNQTSKPYKKCSYQNCYKSSTKCYQNNCSEMLKERLLKL